jgi:hypothetical protein
MQRAKPAVTLTPKGHATTLVSLSLSLFILVVLVIIAESPNSSRSATSTTLNQRTFRWSRALYKPRPLLVRAPLTLRPTL